MKRHSLLRTRSIAAWSAVAALLAACGGSGPVSPPPPPPPLAAQVSFVNQPGLAEAQVVFAPAVRVAIQDGSGAAVTTGSYPVTISLGANPSGATLSGTLTVQSGSGIATFSDLSVERAGDGYALEAVSPGLTGARSAGFAVRTSFAEVSVGGAHSCALTKAGFAYCWGYNGSGELGDGTFTERRTPTAVPGRLTFAQLTAGRDHTCGIARTNATYCWGANSQGQGGGGAGQTPSQVPGGLNFVAISAGTFHTCGLTADRLVYCWGSHSFGALGIGPLAGGSTPKAVAGGHTFVGVSAGDVVYCWGFNLRGQVGDGTTEDRWEPTRVVP